MGVIPLDQGYQVLAPADSTGDASVLLTQAAVLPEQVFLAQEPVVLVAALQEDPALLLGGLTASEQREVIAAGFRGPPGQSGSGDSSVDMLAGEVLGGHRAVYFDGQYVRYADAMNLACLPVFGITEHAALMGAPVRVKRQGVMTGFPGSWEPGPLFLTTQGIFTQTPPEEGTFVHIGEILATTSVLQLDILPPILLS